MSFTLTISSAKMPFNPCLYSSANQFKPIFWYGFSFKLLKTIKLITTFYLFLHETQLYTYSNHRLADVTLPLSYCTPDLFVYWKIKTCLNIHLYTNWVAYLHFHRCKMITVTQEILLFYNQWYTQPDKSSYNPLIFRIHNEWSGILQLHP